MKSISKVSKYTKTAYLKHLCIAGVLGGLFFLMIPPSLFKVSYSTVLTDREGQLLGAMIAKDGQWRFPAADTVPEKFKKALLTFEDRYFYVHPGINPVAMLKAFRDNVAAGKIVRGGSSISMQVIRMSREGQPRTIWEKLVEVVLALRLELHYSKEEILQLYSTHAPFGGNTVGFQTACWRYFNRPGAELSWAEAATLAVLPNAPALIFPGKNQELLKAKRDKLLARLLYLGEIDATTYQLALYEPLPQGVPSFPALAKHLLGRSIKEGQEGKFIRSTLQAGLQERVAAVVAQHHSSLEGNQVHNAAVIVLETGTGNVLAYVGNTESATGDHGNEVDVIAAPRSTGSILKPFLYAALINEGRLLPQALVPDVPFYQKGFNPQNFSKTFEGAVPADKALARSLNVPYVYLLQEYGVERFHYLLKKAGMRSLTQAPGHYGLALILGGAEGTLWDISGMYAAMARALKAYHTTHQHYNNQVYWPSNYLLANSHGTPVAGQEEPLLAADAIWYTFQALLEVNRPETEGAWKQFSSARKIAWKTGTSYGFRDGWAIGVTPEYVTGVWVGNADGEGRPGLTGIEAAAPLLFDVFALLPPTSWFQSPEGEMKKMAVCRKSGFKAGAYCPEVSEKLLPVVGSRTATCSYHQLVHVSQDGAYRVNSQCESIAQMLHQAWFVLPPVMEWFYKDKNPDYQPLPPFKPGCELSEQQTMQLIYPAKASRIMVPRELDGSAGRTVFEIAHRRPETLLYWHLDNQYLGSTRGKHQLGLAPGDGQHYLVVTDEQGESLEHYFEVVSGRRD